MHSSQSMARNIDNSFKFGLVVRALVLASAVTGALLITACNTMEGAGKDIERGGEKLQGAAERNK